MSIEHLESAGALAVKLILASLPFAICSLALSVPLTAWSCWMFGAMSIVAVRHARCALRVDRPSQKRNSR